MTAKTILITAGPTQEPIDPVRYISNRSTGMMGYEIAKAAKKAGFKVCLISGPVFLPVPKVNKFIPVLTADDMRKAIKKNIRGTDVIIMAAAVCDFRPEKVSGKKIKKKERWTLELVKNQDLIATTNKKGLIKIGFALETERAKSEARKKMVDKRLDLIIANEKNRSNDPFGAGKKEIMMIGKNGNVKKISGNKNKLAGAIIKEAITIMNGTSDGKK
ncbi:MAG TPA: phosphopantothenoylcysteine decarboxylase [Candidatus Omnitrophota bacterium]|nr:phosphopantothenoylcysteine decarboxylase [Candidatus Omnitrophota bacterium]